MHTYLKTSLAIAACLLLSSCSPKSDEDQLKDLADRVTNAIFYAKGADSLESVIYVNKYSKLNNTKEKVMEEIKNRIADFSDNNENILGSPLDEIKINKIEIEKDGQSAKISYQIKLKNSKIFNEEFRCFKEDGQWKAMIVD